MLLINDCIANEVDSEFKINSIDYLCKHKNIKKLEDILGLKKKIAQNDWFTIYSKDANTYVIYNASVDDALLNLLEYSFCNDEEVKKIAPTHQYALDRMSVRTPHKSVHMWLHNMNRYTLLKEKVIKPMTKVKLIEYIKFVNKTALRYQRWKKIILVANNKPFRDFDILCFEEILALASGQSIPIYQNLYDENHLKLSSDKFSKFTENDKIEAIRQLINTYVINEYVIIDKERKFSPIELEEKYIELMMRIMCDVDNLNLKLFIERNYSKLVNSYDHLFYSLFKNYDKFIREE